MWLSLDIISTYNDHTMSYYGLSLLHHVPVSDPQHSCFQEWSAILRTNFTIVDYGSFTFLHIPSHFTSHFTSQNTPLVLVTSGARPDVDVLQALCLGSSSTLKAMWQLNNRFSSESSVLFTDWLALCLQTRLLYRYILSAKLEHENFQEWCLITKCKAPLRNQGNHRLMLGPERIQLMADNSWCLVQLNQQVAEKCQEMPRNAEKREWIHRTTWPNSLAQLFHRHSNHLLQAASLKFQGHWIVTTWWVSWNSKQPLYQYVQICTNYQLLFKGQQCRFKQSGGPQDHR